MYDGYVPDIKDRTDPSSPTKPQKGKTECRFQPFLLSNHKLYAKNDCHVTNWVNYCQYSQVILLLAVY